MDSQPKMEPITVTVEEGIRLSGVPRSSFYALIAAGRLQTTKLGRRNLVHYSALKDLLLSGETKAA